MKLVVYVFRVFVLSQSRYARNRFVCICVGITPEKLSYIQKLQSVGLIQCPFKTQPQFWTKKKPAKPVDTAAREPTIEERIK
jgi:hypothetical protein